MGKKYYAVAVGRQLGVFETWSECQSHVHQFAGSKFKSFTTFAEANTFVQTAGRKVKNRSNPIADDTGASVPPLPKKPKGRPRKSAASKADKADAVSRHSGAETNSLNGASGAAHAESRGDSTAAACLDHDTEELPPTQPYTTVSAVKQLPLASGIFATACDGSDDEEAIMVAAVERVESASQAIDSKRMYRMVRQPHVNPRQNPQHSRKSTYQPLQLIRSMPLT